MEINRLIDSKKLLFENLDKSKELYNTQLNLCKESFSELNVHDLRVCIRRFMARFSIIKNLMPPTLEQDYKLVLKPQLSLFNNLRDTQVQILRVQKLVYHLPSLYKYYHYLINREEEYVKYLKNEIEIIDNESLENLVKYFKSELSTFLSYNRITYFHLFRFVKSELDEVNYKFKLSSKENLSSVHKVRISFKKFRYALEILQPIINLNLAELAELKSFQTIMGNIQDNSVFHEKLIAYQNEKNELTKSEFDDIINFIISEREMLIDSFFDNFNIINNFWKEDYNLDN